MSQYAKSLMFFNKLCYYNDAFIAQNFNLNLSVQALRYILMIDWIFKENYILEIRLHFM